MSDPPHPIAAVTHPNPYPYYARMAIERPLHHDPTLGAWVAAGADAVSAVLTSDLGRVRPPAEPVPTALLGTAAGDVFGRLVRMTDDDRHPPLKHAVSATLASIERSEVGARGRRWARALLTGQGPGGDGGATNVAFDLSVYVLGSLLGIPEDRLPQTARWMAEFVPCLAPTSSPAQIERGTTAAGELRDLFRELAAAQRTPPAAGLLPALVRTSRAAGIDDQDTIAANAIGLLSQAYEATTGLIGNTLYALAAHPDLHDAAARDPAMLHQVILEVLRADPPIQNTRRYVARAGIVAGRKMAAGDTILVVLAAANRDPAANPRPERFDVFRTDRRIFTFGAGVHACPGETLAVTITEAGLAELIESDGIIRHLPGTPTYRPSANARVPLLGKPHEAA